MELKHFNPWNWVTHEDQPGFGGRLAIRKPGTTQQQGNSMMQLHREIDRLFDEAFRGFGMPSLFGEGFSSLDKNALLRPQVDISADDNQYTVTVEVPGVERDDVELELSKDSLIIKGEKKQEKEDKDKQYYRVERSYGQFQRVLALPEDAIQDEIAASFKDGVLTVTIPRKAQPKSEVKHIEINKPE